MYSAKSREDYDNNFHKFDESIKTLTVSEPIDIEIHHKSYLEHS